MAPARALLLLIACALLGACASTTIRNSWIDGTDLAGPPKKMVVFVAVTDANLRRLAENQAVRSLPRAVGAVAAHQLDITPEQDEKTLREKLGPAGYDAALVSRLISVDTREHYVPPQTHLMPDPLLLGLRPYHRSFYAYYPLAYAYTTPGYTATTQRVLVETVLYRMPEGRPVWTALTESVNPDSSAQVVDELIEALGRELRTHGLLPPAP